MKLNTQTQSEFFSSVFDSFFFKTGNFPENIKEVISIFEDDEIFIDPFNKNNGYYQYIPLYNRKIHNREGYLLLSAGIDGMGNNTFNDSVFMDENIPLNIYDATDTCYSIFKKWFGRKDILVLKTNGRKMLTEYADYPSASDITDIVETATNIKRHPYFRMGEPVVRLRK